MKPKKFPRALRQVQIPRLRRMQLKVVMEMDLQVERLMQQAQCRQNSSELPLSNPKLCRQSGMNDLDCKIFLHYPTRLVHITYEPRGEWSTDPFEIMRY